MLTSNSSSTTNFPWLFPTDNRHHSRSRTLCCTPLYSHSPDSVLLQFLNFQFKFSNPLATNRLSLYSLGLAPWKTRVTCYQECVFTAPLPSTGHSADNIENIRYFCEVFSARCVATSAARTTENTAPVLLSACLNVFT
jgi:hypothetical protein